MSYVKRYEKNNSDCYWGPASKRGLKRLKPRNLKKSATKKRILQPYGLFQEHKKRTSNRTLDDIKQHHLQDKMVNIVARTTFQT